MDQGVKDMRLTEFLIYGSIRSGSFIPSRSHDLWGPRWARIAYMRGLAVQTEFGETLSIFF